MIVATARDDESEIIAVLDAGADDYLVKPFSAAQLDARIRAVLRRADAVARAARVVVGGLAGSTGGPGGPAWTAPSWT